MAEIVGAHIARMGGVELPVVIFKWLFGAKMLGKNLAKIGASKWGSDEKFGKTRLQNLPIKKNSRE